MIESNFLSKETFCAYVEDMVLSGLTYIEAVVQFSEDNDKSPEELVPFMTQVLIDKIKNCAFQTGMMTETAASILDIK